MKKIIMTLIVCMNITFSFAQGVYYYNYVGETKRDDNFSEMNPIVIIDYLKDVYIEGKISRIFTVVDKYNPIFNTLKQRTIIYDEYCYKDGKAIKTGKRKAISYLKCYNNTIFLLDELICYIK